MHTLHYAYHTWGEVGVGTGGTALLLLRILIFFSRSSWSTCLSIEPFFLSVSLSLSFLTRFFFLLAWLASSRYGYAYTTLRYAILHLLANDTNERISELMTTKSPRETNTMQH